MPHPNPAPDPTTGSSRDHRHFLYVADPLCSWCYGFAPVMDALAVHFDGRLPVRIKLGGLRAGNTVAMRDADRTYIKSAWTRVNAATGQPFDHAFFDRPSFTYDTEPACRAVVTARNLQPARALAMKASISKAFYAENRDVTDFEAIVRVAEAEGFDGPTFRAAFLSPEMRQETAMDFQSAKQMGIEGFPCLLAGTESRYALVTNGYRPIDGMIEGIEAWLAKG